jgi:GT2 family glycosyltransferase
MQIKCSIIIPVHNKANFTKLALEGLSFNPSSYETIIFDNASTDNTEEVVRSFIRPQNPINYIKSSENLGFAKSNNEALKQAQGEYILFLNNDIRVDGSRTGWILSLIEKAEDGSLVGANGALLNSNFEFVKEGKNLERTKYWYLSGWCLLGKRSTFNKLDLGDGQVWNEKFGRAFFEDVDLSYRASKLGIPMKEVNVPVTHFGHTTAKQFNINKLYKDAQKIFREEWKGY